MPLIRHDVTGWEPIADQSAAKAVPLGTSARVEEHPLDAMLFDDQSPQRSETLPHRGHDGWARRVLHLRTRAIPSPIASAPCDHPDPVLMPLTGRAADRLLVSPDQAVACLAMKWHRP